MKLQSRAHHLALENEHKHIKRCSRRSGEGRRLTANLLARAPLGSLPASGRQTPIFCTSTFQMDAMRLSVNSRTSRRVSLYWTSGSPSFSCSSSHDKAQKMNADDARAYPVMKPRWTRQEA